MHNSDSIGSKSILVQLRQKNLSLDNWKKKIPHLSYADLVTVVTDFITWLDKEDQYYIDYLEQLLNYDQDEDRLTEVLEIVLSNATEITITAEWFNTLWERFFKRNTSKILIENFFIFAGQLHQRFHFTNESKFIQTLEKIPSEYFRFELVNFQILNQLSVFDNDIILQHFNKTPIRKEKLRLIVQLGDYPEKQRLKVLKEILINKNRLEDEYIVIAVLIQLTQDIHLVFDDYKKFFAFIESIKDKKVLELLVTEWVKPESLTNEWIKRVILDIVKQDTPVSNSIIESSGEFIADWTEKFRESFLSILMKASNNLQEALAKILSPLWYDERIIKQLLENDNKKVQETLYESVITIYQLITSELQEKFLELFKSEPDNQKFYGLLQGYNIDLEEFKTEVTTVIQNMTDQTKEQLYAGMLIGLGMRWNDLEKPMQAAITGLIKKLSQTLKKALLQGLELVYGSLNIEGINLTIELQSYEYQIEMDKIKLE